MSGWTEADVRRVQQRQAPQAKPSKYKAVKTTVDGIVFDSKKEAQRFHELKLLEKADKIGPVTLQPRYRLIVDNANYPEDGGRSVVLGDYVADFRYQDLETGEEVVEDVKGFKTPLYRWKKRHFEAQYGISIRET